MLTAALALALAPPAAAVDPCPNQPETRSIASGLGTLESIVVDRQGRVVFSETPPSGGEGGRLLRIGRRGSPSRPIVDGIEAPGGLLLHRRGRRLIAGFGDSIPGGVIGNIVPMAGLYDIDPRTGSKKIRAEGLMMANGVARGPDGVIYASNDLGIGIDRVVGSQVTNRWAPVVSGNGLEVDRANEWLYVATTFRPAAIDRVLISDPTRVEAFYRAPAGDIAGGPDGMAIDGQDNLYVAVNLAGEIWKVTPGARACRLASGIPMASDVVFGKTTRKSRFHRGNLYVTSFTGTVTELRGVRPRLKR